MNLSLSQLAQLTNAKLHGNPEHIISSVADLESATESDASFLANSRYTSLLDKTRAGVICVDHTTALTEGKNYLICKDPSHTFQQIAKALLGDRKSTGFLGIHPTAIIHEKAQIGKNVSIGPYAIIDQDAEIGDHTSIGPFAYVGVGAFIGKSCILYAHSVIREYCSIGDRVILQPGAVIGSCGFGYITNEKGEHVKLEQLGNVILEDDVEIGANSTIDRARFKTTKICKGSKIDNLVQIAHNVEIGEHNILASQTGIAGSTKTGRYVMMGGQVGIIGHLEITEFTQIGSRGGVGKSLKKSGKYAGSPVMPLAQHNRVQVHLRNLTTYVKRIETLEKNLAKLESQLSCFSEN